MSRSISNRDHMSTKHLHEFETLTCPFTNNEINIDIEISDIIKEKWENGIETMGCCQEMPIDCLVSRLWKFGTGIGYILLKNGTEYNMKKTSDILKKYGYQPIKSVKTHIYFSFDYDSPLWKENK